MKYEFKWSMFEKFVGKICPCLVLTRETAIQDNICPCKEFRETQVCRCNLFKKVNDE